METEWVQDGSTFIKLRRMLPSGEDMKIMALVPMWYLCSSLTNNLGKLVLTDFNYPITLTVFQFLFLALYAILYGRIHNFLGIGESYVIRPVGRPVLRFVVPLALFNIVGHVLSAFAIAHASVSSVHTVKALSPLFTVALSRMLLKTQHDAAVYVSLAPLITGVMLACWSDASYSAVGLLCALLSSLVFVVQNIVSKKAFVEGSLDELNLLFHSSWVAFVMMLPMWLYSEGAVLIFGDQLIDPNVVLHFCLNGVTHFGQNILAFTMMTMVSPVAYSIASLLKRVFVIGAAIIWFSTPVTTQNLAGLCLTFLGLYLYNRAKPSKAAAKHSLPRFTEVSSSPLEERK